MQRRLPRENWLQSKYKVISIIVSASRNEGAIGKNSRIPWDLPGERFYFKSVTLNSALIMGRLTYESIGRPLPERMNIVLSKTTKIENPEVITKQSLKEGIEEAESRGYKSIFIIGGERLYREALSLAEKIYLTEVEFAVENADAFFPKIPEEDFILESESKPECENGIWYVKKVFVRKYPPQISASNS